MSPPRYQEVKRRQHPAGAQRWREHPRRGRRGERGARPGDRDRRQPALPGCGARAGGSLHLAHPSRSTPPWRMSSRAGRVRAGRAGRGGRLVVFGEGDAVHVAGRRRRRACASC